jgi:hypothetical protein
VDDGGSLLVSKVDPQLKQVQAKVLYSFYKVSMTFFSSGRKIAGPFYSLKTVL